MMHLFRRSLRATAAIVVTTSVVALVEPLPAAATELAPPTFLPNLVTLTGVVTNGNDTLSAAPIAPADSPPANGSATDFITRNNRPQLTVAATGANLSILAGDCVQLLRAPVLDATPPVFGRVPVGAAARTTATAALLISDTNAGQFGGNVPDGRYAYRYVVRRGWAPVPQTTPATMCTIGTTTGTVVHTSGVVGDVTKPITVDTVITAPVPELLPVSDTGISNSDRITDPMAIPATPGGIAVRLDHPEPGVKVDLHRTGNKLTGVGGVDANSTVVDLRLGATFPTTSGNYGYTATWVDRAGNSLTSVLVVTLDFDNPAAPARLAMLPESDSGSSDADQITNVTRPSFAVTGAEDGAVVSLYRCAGAGPCTATTRSAVLATRIGNGTITPTVATAANTATNTSWRFVVDQRKPSGRLSPTMSVPLSVVIKTAPEPVPAPPTLVKSSQTGSGAGANKTSAISPTFNVARGTGRVELLRDGTVVGFSLGAGDITDPGPLANGTYSYTTRSTDIAGNVSAASAPLVLRVENSQGYWLLGGDGGVFSFGNAEFFGSTGGMTLNAPVVSMATAPNKDGYWLLGRDGGVFSFGNVGFFGSTGDRVLNSPVVGMVPTPTGKGYWLFAEDGGVFTFGDAPFHGSPAGEKRDSPVVAMLAAPDGRGYWLVTKKGKVFAFGSATPLTGVDGIALNVPIVGMEVTPSGNGLWLVASDGGIFALGDAPFHGSAGNIVLNQPIIGMLATADGRGYLLIASDGGVFTYGAAKFLGSTGGATLNAPIVGIAGS